MTNDAHESGQGQSGSDEDGISSGDNRLAKLALLLDTPEKAEGRVPDTDELWDWMHGCVQDPVRVAQIRSHVARDPDVFELWHEMRLSENGVEQWIASAVTSSGDSVSSQASSPPESAEVEQSIGAESTGSVLDAPNKAASNKVSPLDLSGWFSKLGALLPPLRYSGVAFAAILGGVLAVNLTKTQPVDVWSDWQGPKSTQPNSTGTGPALPDQLEIQAVLAGVAEQMNELSITVQGPNGETLPRAIPKCNDATESSACSPRRQALHELGSLALQARVVCLTSLDMPDALVSELSRISELIATDSQAGRFAEPVGQWVAASEQDSQCAAVNVILSRALLAASS